jgi:GntR family transcriptional regulator
MTVARARHEHVAGVLRQRITRRDYAIGQALPPESALCAEFEVSRGPVRQALATLKNEGLIKVSRGKPAVVRSHDATQTLDTFTPFTQWARRNGRTPGSRTLEIARRRASEPATVALQFARSSAGCSDHPLRGVHGRFRRGPNRRGR